MATLKVKDIKIPFPVPIPQILKPAIEAALGRSFYTGQSTLTRHEQTLLPEQQFRANTTALSKMIGKPLGLSPIVLDNLINGYTGGMGVAFAQAISQPFAPSKTPEQTLQRLSDMPVIGGAFQPNDAGGITNTVYEKMLDIKKVEATFKDRLAKGDAAGAKQLLQERGNEIALSQAADQYIATIGKLTQYRNAIVASNATPEQKRAAVDKIKQVEIRLSSAQREAVDKVFDTRQLGSGR